MSQERVKSENLNIRVFVKTLLSVALPSVPLVKFRDRCIFLDTELCALKVKLCVPYLPLQPNIQQSYTSRVLHLWGAQPVFTVVLNCGRTHIRGLLLLTCKIKSTLVSKEIPSFICISITFNLKLTKCPGISVYKPLPLVTGQFW